MNTKNKIWFFMLVMTGALFMFINSCEKDKDEDDKNGNENADAACLTMTFGSAFGECSGVSYQACCTESGCYYIYKNKKYPCNGTDCTETATKLVEEMCGISKKSTSVLLSITEQEIIELTKTLLEAKTPCATCP